MKLKVYGEEDKIEDISFSFFSFFFEYIKEAKEKSRDKDMTENRIGWR